MKNIILCALFLVACSGSPGDVTDPDAGQDPRYLKRPDDPNVQKYDAPVCRVNAEPFPVNYECKFPSSWTWGDGQPCDTCPDMPFAPCSVPSDTPGAVFVGVCVHNHF